MINIAGGGCAAPEADRTIGRCASIRHISHGAKKRGQSTHGEASQLIFQPVLVLMVFVATHADYLIQTLATADGQAKVLSFSSAS
jgi:hypothetical protein